MMKIKPERKKNSTSDGQALTAKCLGLELGGSGGLVLRLYFIASVIVFLLFCLRIGVFRFVW